MSGTDRFDRVNRSRFDLSECEMADPVSRVHVVGVLVLPLLMLLPGCFPYYAAEWAYHVAQTHAQQVRLQEKLEARKTQAPRDAQATLILAEQGDLEAQVRISQMYSNGYGVARDEVEATRWLLTAAENGSSVAQFRLGQRFEDGLGLVQDYTRAYAWYEVAIVGGIGAAMAWQNVLTQKMTAEQITEGRNMAGEFRKKITANIAQNSKKGRIPGSETDFHRAPSKTQKGSEPLN